MRLILDIAGVLLCIQGIGPLVQRVSGRHAHESAFVVNAVPSPGPWPAIALAVLGVAVLALGRNPGAVRARC